MLSEQALDHLANNFDLYARDATRTLLIAQARSAAIAREACEIVHATANGNTYGLTVEEQLEALRLAARHCSEAIGKAS
jgi:hypothetical protein